MFTIKELLCYTFVMNTNFIEKAKSFGIDIDDNALDTFEKLYLHLIEENEKFNLTAITDREKVYLLHFLDSISSASFIPKNAKLCDVGSGGGFPALPLKIVRSDIDLTMLDSVNKKVNFLNETVALLNLKYAVAIHSRIEDFARTDKREYFDVVTSRAVAKLPTLLEYAMPLVKVGGIFIAYKTDVTNELSESKNAIKVLGAKLTNTVNIDISPFVTRTLLIFTKVKVTPKEFPRGKNKERLTPIL